MPRTFTTANSKIASQVREVVQTYHSRLISSDATWTILMVSAPRDKESGEPTGPALSSHGWPCAAIIKIINLRDRTAGMSDILLQLDGDKWNDWSRAEQDSLIDHEFTHIELTGESDDIGRPKMKIRPHDHELGVFKEVIERHKENALDAKLVQDAWKACIQGVLDWG